MEMCETDEAAYNTTADCEADALQPCRYRDHESHYGKVMLSGVGFLADSYNLWCINIVTEMMQMIDYKEVQTHETVGVVKTSMLVGCIMGQVLFGALGDAVGRRPTFIATCLLCIVGCLGSAFVVDSPEYGVYTQLAAWRFVLGLGVGGEYPIASTITSESSSKASRGRHLALLFSMQGVGRLLCNLVLVGLIQSNPTAHDFNWLTVVGLGAVPPILALYFRITMEETEPFKAKDVYKKTAWEVVSENWVLLVGVSGCWFLMDVMFYGNSLFSGDVTQAMGVADTPLEQAWQNMYLNLIALPGYILAVLFMDMVGRWRLQVSGFVGVAALFLILGFFTHQLQAYPGSYLAIYAGTFLLNDFGPNTTIFVMAATVFPTSARTTCAGIAAATGKLGAVMGGLLFKPIQVNYGIHAVFLSCAAVSILGGAWTIAFVDDAESETLDDGYSGRVADQKVEDFVE